MLPDGPKWLSYLIGMYIRKSSWDFNFLHISVVSFQISVGLFDVFLDMIKIYGDKLSLQ